MQPNQIKYEENKLRNMLCKLKQKIGKNNARPSVAIRLFPSLGLIPCPSDGQWQLSDYPEDKSKNLPSRISAYPFTQLLFDKLREGVRNFQIGGRRAVILHNSSQSYFNVYCQNVFMIICLAKEMYKNCKRKILKVYGLITEHYCHH